MTGRYPQELNALSNLGAGKEGVYPPGVVHLSQRFAQAGYRTVNIGKWHHPGSEAPWQECDPTDLFRHYAGYMTLGEGFDESAWRVVHRPGGTKIILGGIYPGGEDNPSRYRRIEWSMPAACLPGRQGQAWHTVPVHSSTSPPAHPLGRADNRTPGADQSHEPVAEEFFLRPGQIRADRMRKFAEICRDFSRFFEKLSINACVLAIAQLPAQ